SLHYTTRLPSLHSFPTRRSSDLFLDAIVVDAGHERHVLVLQEPAGGGKACHRNPAVVKGVHRRRCVFAVHHRDQEFHADRCSAGRTPACASASLTSPRMRCPTWSSWAAASTSRQRRGSAAAISW